MAKIEPINDVSVFVSLLEKCKLLSDDALAAVRSLTAAHDNAHENAKSLARQLVKEGKLTRWQANQLLLGFSNLTVGKYRLLDQVGKGPLGRVYLAEHGQLNKQVSLKVLPSRFGDQPEVLKRFLEEANQAGALNHRNVVHIFDVGKDDENRHFLAMEYVEGKDLARLVEASGPLPPVQAIDLARQAAEGLAHAHEKNLIHGNLQPSSVMVDGSGVVKILDLGLSGLAESSLPGGGEESTEAPTLASLAFRAPELLRGDRRSDVRSDLYSLGAVLHFLLSGQAPPNNAADPGAALQKIPGTPAELLNLCDKLLAADPASRPESAPMVAAALAVAARAATALEKPAERPPAERPSSAGKAKRPLVAKPLESPPDSIVVVDESSAANEPIDSLAGFSIKTGRKRKVTAASSPPPAAPAATAEGTAVTTRSKLPLILAAAIGGGVLATGLLIAIVLVVMNRQGPTLASSKTAPKDDTAAVATKSAGKESNPESNPEANPESNPEPTPAQADETAASDAGKAEPTAGKSAPPESQEKRPPVAALPMPDPAATPAPTEPKPEPPMPAPAPTTPTPAPPAPTPEPAPAPPTPASAANPFAGFAAAVELPPLASMGKAGDGALESRVLGPVQIPPNAFCIIKLKGGETAYRGKTKFLLDAANQGTAEREWEFRLQNDNDPPLVIARMSLMEQENQLTFAWTEEATNQPAAPYLCNCVLTFSAGAGNHQAALRVPLKVDPLAADVEKPISEKFNIDNAPSGKQVKVAIGPLVGGPPKHKIDPSNELEAAKSSAYLFAGNADDALYLGYKIDVSMPAKTLQIVGQPYFMLPGMAKPDRYTKTTTRQAGELAARRAQKANFDLQAAAQLPAGEPKKQAETRFKADLDLAQKGLAVVEQLKSTSESLKEGGKIHFRAYFLADDVQVVLVHTGGPAAAPAPAPAAK